MKKQITLAEIQAALRHTATVHENHVIANAAAALAVKLEGIGTAFGCSYADVTELDRAVIRHSLAKSTTA